MNHCPLGWEHVRERGDKAEDRHAWDWGRCSSSPSLLEAGSRTNGAQTKQPSAPSGKVRRKGASFIAQWAPQIRHCEWMYKMGNVCISLPLQGLIPQEVQSPPICFRHLFSLLYEPSGDFHRVLDGVHAGKLWANLIPHLACDPIPR